jgi:hypothetical protein
LHFDLRKVLGIGVPVLLGTALAASVAALPAHAQSYQDTSLSAGAVTDETFGGANLAAANDGATQISLSGTGVTWSLHGTVSAGVQQSGSTISYTGGEVGSPPDIVAVATDDNGNAEALVLSVVIGNDSIQLGGTPPQKVTVSGLADTDTAGTVTFSAVDSDTNNAITYAESNLPAGLTSGSPVLTYVGGTAAPGTYGEIRVSATDTDGAVLNGSFALTVSANSVNNYGNYVNKYGNGFDAYQQHDYAGAIVAGWTATQHDPATHFILNNGTHTSAYQIEYAPNGSGSGLCVSDPHGGWASDPLPDGLILAPCNTGPFQQFIPQSNGTLKNVATGLTVDPAGTGAQLRGESSSVAWGGSVYNWTSESSFPS